MPSCELCNKVGVPVWPGDDEGNVLTFCADCIAQSSALVPPTPEQADSVPEAVPDEPTLTDLSWKKVSDFVYRPGVHFEHLQSDCLSLAMELERLNKHHAELRRSIGIASSATHREAVEAAIERS